MVRHGTDLSERFHSICGSSACAHSILSLITNQTFISIKGANGLTDPVFLSFWGKKEKGKGETNTVAPRCYYNKNKMLLAVVGINSARKSVKRGRMLLSIKQKISETIFGPDPAHTCLTLCSPI